MDYRERVTATPLFRWLLRLVVLVPALIALFSILLDDEAAWTGGLSLLLILVVLILVERWFLVLEVHVQPGQVEAAFGPFRKRLQAVEIDSVDAEPYSWMLYGGWGIRWGFQKRRAWTVPFLRTGIVLGMKDGTRYFISSRRPERLRAAVETMLGESMPDTGNATGGVRG